MNNTDVMTVDKVMLTVRLHPKIYKRICKKVNKKKENVRGYSINQYITELVMNDLENN